MLVKYLRWPNRSPYACIVAVPAEQGKVVRVGWSQCHPRDRFNKKLARQIAYNRAINGWNSHPASRPTYEDENTEQLINLEMQRMIDKAESYFSNSKPQKSGGPVSSILRMLNLL